MGRPAPKGAAPPGLFYGYTIIAASAALEICTAPGNPAGLSAFLEPMMADLGMTRTAISATWTGALLGASVVAPLGGLALDRFGPCAVGLVATAGLSLSLLVLSGATSGAVCGAALLGVRVAGPECLVIVGSTTVNRWWVRRRGWASVLKSSKKVAMHGFPAVASWAVGVAGWRVTLRWIAAGVAVAGSLASTALSLDPESLGVFPDGDVSPPSPTIAAVEAACSGPSGKPTRRGGVATSQGGDRGAAAVRKRVGGGATVRDASNDRAGVKGISETAAGSEGSIDAREGSSSAPTDTEKGSVEPVWTFEEVMGEPLFWLLIGTNFVFSLFRTGVAMHRVDLYARTGIPKDQIALTTVRAAIANTCGSVGTGLLLDHLGVPTRVWLLIGTYTAQAIGIALLSAPPSSPFGISTALRAQLWVCQYGLFVGAQSCLRSVVVADLFGRKSLGRVNGVMQAVATVAVGLGPLLFGWCRELTGSYTAATRVVLVVALGCTGVLALWRHPRVPKPKVA
eukprot:m.385995 g.385995  ORF g.385995 m.385995 type:complete len:511 (-) comp16744_c0_seq19:80-1612(-)